MGAIAVSEEDERRIVRLRRKLKIRSKSGLVRMADVLVAQVIAIANESFRKELGVLPRNVFADLVERLRFVLGL